MHDFYPWDAISLKRSSSAIFLLPNVGSATGIQYKEARFDTEHPTKHRTAPHNNYSSSNVNTVKVEKPCHKLMHPLVQWCLIPIHQEQDLQWVTETCSFKNINKHTQPSQSDATAVSENCPFDDQNSTSGSGKESIII